MDRILFGDNQFFGINHMSEEKARAQAMKFRDAGSILEVLDAAHELGIKTFMCTTHDRIDEICDHMRSHPARYADYEYFPCMPYAHKYANSLGQLGLFGTLKKYAPGSVVSAAFKGAMSLINKDVYELMKLLVDAELKRFQGLNTKVVFLQNVVTDLLLGFRLKDLFVAFSEHVRKKYNAEAGFITMNLPALLDLLEQAGLDNPIVCSSINKIGFRMCGGIELYEKTIRERRFRPIAMSIFASGAIPAGEAIDYICRQKQIQSIVFGASSRSHIQQTKDLIGRYGV